MKAYIKNPLYHKYTMRINRLKKEIMTLKPSDTLYESKKSLYLASIKQRRRIKSLLANPEAIRIKYVRYADD